MKDKVIVEFSDGRKKEIEIPKYGEITLNVRNCKIAEISVKQKEKIC